MLQSFSFQKKEKVMQKNIFVVHHCITVTRFLSIEIKLSWIVLLLCFFQDKLRSHDVISFPAIQGNVHNNGKYFLNVMLSKDIPAISRFRNPRFHWPSIHLVLFFCYLFPWNIQLRLVLLRSQCWRFHTFRNDIAVCHLSLGPLGLYVFPVHEDFPVVSILFFSLSESSI